MKWSARFNEKKMNTMKIQMKAKTLVTFLISSLYNIYVFPPSLFPSSHACVCACARTLIFVVSASTNANFRSQFPFQNQNAALYFSSMKSNRYSKQFFWFGCWKDKHSYFSRKSPDIQMHTCVYIENLD